MLPASITRKPKAIIQRIGMEHAKSTRTQRLSWVRRRKRCCASVCVRPVSTTCKKVQTASMKRPFLASTRLPKLTSAVAHSVVERIAAELTAALSAFKWSSRIEKIVNKIGTLGLSLKTSFVEAIG